MVYYVIMDNLDGKQARRTGSSSPLGQLCDHGLDATTILPYTSIVVAMITVRDDPHQRLLTFAFQVAGHLGGFLAHWQEHYTGEFPTGFGWIGVVEASLSFAGLGFLFGSFDTVALQNLMATRVSGLGFELQLQHLATAFFVVAGFALCLSSLCVVASSAVKTRQLGAAVSDLAPILILLTSSFMWSDECHVSVGITLKLLVASLSLLYTLPMTIASMARRDFPKRQPTLLLYLALVVMSRLLPVRQVAWIVRVAAVYIIGGLSIWIYVVSRQITTHLGINMFTITPKTAA